MSLLLAIKGVSTLLAIIFVIYIAGYIFKRRAHQLLAKNTRIKIIERQIIDQKTLINLVRIDETELVIITAAQNMSMQVLAKPAPQINPLPFIKTHKEVH